jgi:dTMP kinase
MITKGKFIVVEGLEGAGKTTAMQTICNYLGSKVQSLVTTREPGGTRVGELVRALIKEEIPGEVLDARAELFLLYAARVQHITQIIKPALLRGDWVLSDRFELSTIAYQGGGRGLDPAMMTQVSDLCLQGFTPDLTFFLDITPEAGLYRVNQRGKSDRIERESLIFFHQVYQTYHQAIAQMKNIVVIDASQPLQEVQKSIIEHLEQFYATL